MTIARIPARVSGWGGPTGPVLQEGHRAPWAAVSGRALMGWSLNGSEGFPIPLEGTFSNTLIYHMPKLLFKLNDFGTHSETFKTNPARAIRRTHKSGSPGYGATGGRHMAPWAAASGGILPASPPRDSGAASEHPSRARLLRPDLLPEIFEPIPGRVPHSSR